MRRSGPGPRLAGRFAAVALLVLAMAVDALPAHADLYAASRDYKKGEYARAFHEFLALARLGQPLAQFDVAYMYAQGQGTRQSAIHAYAWAKLAAQNGQARAVTLARQLRPTLALAPGSRRVARWITAPYTPAALARRLLPQSHLSPAARRAYRAKIRACRPVRTYKPDFPLQAKWNGEQWGLIETFTVFPDGTARLPHVLFQLPVSAQHRQFDALARESVLRSRFARRPAGSAPVTCSLAYRFVMWGLRASDYPGLESYLYRVKRDAQAGDPNSELNYGLLLMGGLPQLHMDRHAALSWFVKAAQAGLPLAQFETGAGLLMGVGLAGWGNTWDTAKGLRWLHLAVAQREPHAEVLLAEWQLRGKPSLATVRQAVQWLSEAAAQGNRFARLYLAALLAASPQPAIRDPQRALLLEKQADEDSLGVDPTGVEIRAAALAAAGHFMRAVKDERRAIERARRLRWNLAPLQQRLARYQAHQSWYGNLLSYGVTSPAGTARGAQAARAAPESYRGSDRRAQARGHEAKRGQ